VVETGLLPLAGKTILLLPRYTATGPSSRLRMGQFVPLLEAAGATVRSEPFFDDAYLTQFFGSGQQSRTAALRGYSRRMRLLATVRADMAWVERELFPFLPGRLETMLRWRRIPYVVDMDDAVFHRYDMHRSAAVRGVLGRKLVPLLRGAAAATMGNPYLVNYARSNGAKRVVDVPTVVDPDRYPLLPPPVGERLRLGWIGTPANARYLDVVIEALRRLGPSVPVTLVTIGAPELPGLPVPQEAHAWSEDSEGPLLAGIDVGVMPLVDDPFERGKCGYKLIQYMAAGRAVIGSPVGVNADIITPDCGLLASSVEDWMGAIRMLAGDPERRAAMGRAGRSRVEQHYARNVIATKLITLFKEVMA
jgi:glycosyltransferase involved in cell wall biosynthesis